MTWKFTAALSGVGLLATWLASVPAPVPSTPAQAAAPQVGQATSPASSEIVELAEQLERRVMPPPGAVPARDPFRFAARPGTGQPVPSETASAAPEVAPVPPARIYFSGVAVDRLDDRDVRLAIISTTDGVVIAREGEPLGAEFTVAAISDDTLTLRRVDGSTLTLPLSGR